LGVDDPREHHVSISHAETTASSAPSRLATLLDRESMQSLMDEFYRLAGVGVGIIDAEGEILVATGWQDICTRFHRVHPETRSRCVESDTVLSRGVPADEYRLYRCRNGMWDAATPIVVAGEHVGSVIVGQFFFTDEGPDREAFRAQAQEFGFDEAEYLAALDRVPRWTREKVDAAMRVHARLAGMIAGLGHAKVMLQQAAESNALQNEQIALAQKMARVGYWDYDIATRQPRWSEMMFAVFGRDPAVGVPPYDGHREFIHPDDWETFDTAVEAAGAGMPYDRVVRVLFADGSTHFVHTLARPQYGADGEIKGLFGTSQDVTATLRGQQELAWDLQVNRALSALYPALVRPGATVAQIAGVVLDEACRLTGSEHGFVSEIDPVTGDNVAHTLTAMMAEECSVAGNERRSAFAPGPDGRFRGLCGVSLNDRAPCLTNAPFEHPLRAGTPVGHVCLERFVSVPVLLGDELVGEIALANAPRDYEERDVEALRRMAEFYALAVRHRRTAEREQSRQEAVEAIGRLVASLVAATEEDEIWRLVCTAVHALFPRSQVVAVALDEADDSMRLVDWRGFEDNSEAARKIVGVAPGSLRFPMSALSSRQRTALESGRLRTASGGIGPLVLGRIPRSVCRDLERLLKIDAVDVVGLSADGRVVGSLAVLHSSTVTVEQQRETVETMVNQAGIALQRVRAAAGLRASECGLARAQAVGHVGSWEWDPNADTLSWSDEMYRLFAVTREFELGYEGIEAMIHPDDREANTRAVGAMLSGADEVEYEFRLLRPDGEERHVLQRVEVERDDGGAPRRLFGIIQDITEIKHSEEQARRAAERLRQALQATADAMGTVVETRDPYTAGHERRVAALGEAIARKMGLDEETASSVRVAGSMHDVGKVSVPAEILSKPARLTQMEFELVKRHAEIGHDILKGIDFDWPLAEIVLQHHERLDGSGYPGGLTGDAICIEARILAVADVVEAMSSHRPYRPSLGTEAALEEMRDGRGTLYDAAAVDACLEVIEKDGFVLPD
jgi:PAS domain S-box-containing protein